MGSLALKRIKRPLFRWRSGRERGKGYYWLLMVAIEFIVAMLHKNNNINIKQSTNLQHFDKNLDKQTHISGVLSGGERR